MNSIRQMAMMFLGIKTAACAANAGPSDPDLIFRKSTTFKLLTPNDKLAVYGIDDPLVDGVVCHYTTPEKGGLSGALGVVEQTSDISLACRQYGTIKFKGTFTQGDVIFSERRSLVFKKMQIVSRGGYSTENSFRNRQWCPRLADHEKLSHNRE